MKQIEIPQISERDRTYHFFEKVPGLLSWSVLLLPVVLSIISPTLAAYFVIAYLLMWFIKAIVLNARVVQGFKRLNQYMAYDWYKMAQELDDPKKAFDLYEDGISPRWHYRNLISRSVRRDHDGRRLANLKQLVIIAVYNESTDIVEPTIQSVLKSSFNPKNIIVVIAYEERGGETVKSEMTLLAAKYNHEFYSMHAIEHPANIAGEVIGKGGNITFAGRWAKTYLEQQAIDPINVLVTTLDSDNRPHPEYFSAVTYAYLGCPDPIRASFQPISMFTNNIWDVPAPMRVVATGNSFWNIALALRPHMIRNFASHSQGMQSLIETDFWSVRTIVEDGHQYWRSYFTFDGKYEVYPIMVPIYQDAVLSRTYVKTLRAQFVQVRRWAWGASDIAYVLQKGWRQKNHIPKLDLFFKTSRLIEGHVAWATASLILLLAAFAPLYLAPQASQSLIANQLPIIASRIQTLAMVMLFLSIYLSIRLLPPKPPRYKTRHRVYMLLQWVYLPVTTIVYSSFAAINSQTRLLFGRYLGKFDATEKVVKK